MYAGRKGKCPKKQILIMSDIAEYYDNRAKYQLLPYDEDWDNVIDKFSKVLNSRILKIFGNRTLKVLDCTCGIGTQAIALGKLGHDVTASDISPEMVKYAETYSSARNVFPKFIVQDLREEFPDELDERFDLTVSLNNSLIFVSNDENGDKELLKSFQNLYKLTKPGGCLMISLRPYDEYQEKQLHAPPNRQWKFREIQGETVRFRQQYNWLSDNKHYVCDTYYDFLENEGIRTVKESVKVRAWKEHEIVTASNQAGFTKNQIEIVADPNGHYREKWFYLIKPRA